MVMSGESPKEPDPSEKGVGAGCRFSLKHCYLARAILLSNDRGEWSFVDTEVDTVMGSRASLVANMMSFLGAALIPASISHLSRLESSWPELGSNLTAGMLSLVVMFSCIWTLFRFKIWSNEGYAPFRSPMSDAPAKVVFTYEEGCLRKSRLDVECPTCSKSDALSTPGLLGLVKVVEGETSTITQSGVEHCVKFSEERLICSRNVGHSWRPDGWSTLPRP